MDWRDEIVSGLPSPRGDEPPGLRRDIEDELADHLACAMARERTAAESDEAARRAALARFGNPRLVACKLWFDAMKEKIMRDRIVMVALSILTLASLAALGLSWTAFDQSRTANAEMLKKMELIAQTIQEQAIPPNQCVLNLAAKENGTDRPLEGVKLELSTGGLPGYGRESKFLLTQADGTARSSLRPGSSWLRYPSTYQPPPPNAFGSYCLYKELNLYGGESTRMDVVFPQGESMENFRNIRIDLEWPAEFKKLLQEYPSSLKSQYLLGCWLARTPRELKIGRDTWQSETAQFTLNDRGEFVDFGWDKGALYEKRYRPGNRAGTLAQGQPKQEDLMFRPGTYCFTNFRLGRQFDGIKNPWMGWNPEKMSSSTLTVAERGDAHWRLTLPPEMADALIASFRRQSEFDLPMGGGSDKNFHDITLGLKSCYGEGENARAEIVITRYMAPGPKISQYPVQLREGQSIQHGDCQIQLLKVYSPADVNKRHVRVKATYLPVAKP